MSAPAWRAADEPPAWAAAGEPPAQAAAGEPPAWPAADERLVRHYRRLLLAYSGRYRRRHGAEIVTTLLEMAEPGRSGPSAGEAWHLITSGLRQRFRLPAGRPFALVTAVLATLVLAVSGAAAGSWAGERTFAELPSRAETLRLLSAAVPPADISMVMRQSEPGNADVLYVGLLPRDQRPDAVPTWTVEQARDGLTAAGWTVTEFRINPPVPQADMVCAEPDCVDRFASLRRNAEFTAQRDGLVLHGSATDAIGGEPGKVWVGGIGATLFAARSAAYLPLVVAGGLLGGLAGWLLVAALAYRIRRVGAGRAQAATAFTGVALTLSVLPVWAVVLNTVLLGETFTATTRSVFLVHAGLRFTPYVQGTPAWLIPGCALLAVSAAVLAAGLSWGRETPGPASAAQLHSSAVR